MSKTSEQPLDEQQARPKRVQGAPTPTQTPEQQQRAKKSLKRPREPTIEDEVATKIRDRKQKAVERRKFLKEQRADDTRFHMTPALQDAMVAWMQQFERNRRGDDDRSIATNVVRRKRKKSTVPDEARQLKLSDKFTRPS